MAQGRRSKSAEKSIFFAQKWSQLRLGARVSTPNEEGRNGHRRFERKFRSASLNSRSAVKTPSTHADSEKNVIDELEFEDLKRFQYALWTSSQKQGGRVDLDTFRNTMKGNLRRPSVEIDILVKTLFDEIDISGLGSLSCSDICTFLLCKHKARDLRLAKTRLIQIKEPIKTCVLPNREPIARTVARRHGGGFIVAKTDGTLIFWSSDLKITKQRSLVFEEQTQRVTPKWYTDFLFLNEISKFVSSTGDRELEFCEMTTFEPYCRIIGLDTVPVCLTWGIRPQTTQYVIAWGDSNGDVSILLLTDIAELLRTWKVSSASGSLPTVHFEQLLTQPKVQFLRWHVHSEWVVKVHYEASMDKIISCCNEESTAVIIGCVTGSTPIGQASRIKPTRTQLTSSSGSTTPSGRPLRTHLVGRPSIAAPRSRTALQAKHRLAIDQQVFKIYKGARTFAYSRDRNLLVTGGMDRLIRIWNPVVPSRPVLKLFGHSSPLVYLHVNSEENSLLTISSDRCIKVWELEEYNCLMSFGENHQSLKGDLQSCMYSPTSRSILLVMDHAALVEFETNPYAMENSWWKKRRDSEYYAGNLFTKVPSKKSTADARLPQTWTMQWEAVHSHKFPVTACKYNATFGHLVTASANSVIKVWHFDSGKFLYAFDGGSGNMAITSICFDLAGRRLLTAGQDGIIRIWNYHSGACLRELCPGEINDRNCEISSLQCVRIGFNRFIVSVGWDRHINLYADVIEDRGALKESIGQIQRPIPHWGHDLTIGHAEDIQALAVGSSGFLATADFAGEILVWNTVSGHIFKRLSVISSTERTSSVTSISGTSMSRSRNTAWGPRGTSKSCLLSEGSEHSRSATFTSMANSVKTTETASSTQVSSASPKRRLEGAALGGEWCVNSLLFLGSRERTKTAASLVSSGPSDKIHFWAVYMRQPLYASFPLRSVVSDMDAFPTTMAVGVSNASQDPFMQLRRIRISTADKQGGDVPCESHLFVGDACGRIHVWNIRGYAERGPETHPPPLLYSWRGHTKAISALEVVNSSETLVTTSSDRNVRLWKWDGSYIGTFGQPIRWDLNDPDTFQSPMHPFDVLIDSLTMPEALHRIMQTEETSDDPDAIERLATEQPTAVESSQTTKKLAAKEEQSQQSLKKTAEVAPSFETTDFFEVHPEVDSVTTEGKRLRNLRTQPKRVNHGGPNDYQTLKIFEFTTSPEITELKFSTPEQELADQLAAKLDEPLPPLKPSISQRIFAIN